MQVGFDFASYRAHIEGTDASAKAPQSAAARRLDAAMEKVLRPQQLAELKEVAESIKQEEDLKASGNDPVLREAIEDCNKPCTQASIEAHTCAQVDVCCSAYGNSKCIKAPGQPSFAEQQTGVRHSTSR